MSSVSYYQYGSLVCGVTILPVAVLGIIGNGIAASVFRRQRAHAAISTYSLSPTSSCNESRSSINILLIGLTIIDTLLLILATPLCATIAMYNYSNSNSLLTPIAYMTLITYPAAMMAQCASVWTMVLISLERYTAICHPLSTRIFGSAGKTKKALAVVTVAAIIYNLCRFGEYRLNEFGNATLPNLRENQIYMNVYMNWSYFTLVFALPFFVLLVVNSFITRTIVRARRQRRVIVSISQNNRREQRTALMMAAVVLAYMACNTLALILNGWEAVGLGGEKTDEGLFAFLSDLNNLLIEAHSGLTFLVYFRFSGHFRGFVYYQMRFFCCLPRARNGETWNYGQRPTETLVNKSKGLALLLANEQCRKEMTKARHRSSSSSSRRSSGLDINYRSAESKRLLTPYHRTLSLRHSAYITVGRGSLETHLDPFRI